MWILRGLRKGVMTSGYPGKVSDDELAPDFPLKEPEECPFGALENGKFDIKRCLNCRLCNAPLGRKLDVDEILNPMNFKNSLHVFFLDVGTCHACNREVAQLSSPYYDVHRLGIFFTPTPKHADVLLVAGCPTDDMIPVLREAYELMPEPKRVLALGACANGSLCGRDTGEFVPVDGYVAGCPPAPVQIIRALLKISGRDVE
ncbi:hypothetical protein [Thermococcus sp.]|uniref:NADH-quinone oxidoreductase subunit B family protein n=1 Tax=Thermococcus sp. TaxID=35749 RepID=UPI00261F59C5|nr:hypothetical protein [Thermococcus sp.]